MKAIALAIALTAITPAALAKTPTPVPEVRRFYTVKEGDTLGDIARRTGKSVQRLAFLNRIPNEHFIVTGFGLRLTLPRRDGRAPSPPSYAVSQSDGSTIGYSTSSIPWSVVACESGGSYTAYNSSSGAYGKYQIMPLHYGPGGICEGMGRSPAEQDECARRILAAQGPSAWNCW